MRTKTLVIAAVVILSLAALLASCGGGGGGSTPPPLLSDAKAITAFSFTSPAATGAIDEGAKTISVIVPYGTNKTALIASFTTTGASVKVGAKVQVSSVSQNNFTDPVAYVVTAADGSMATYTVTVTVALNTAKAITAFSIAGATGTINEGAKTISVTMPYGTNKAGLIASFSTTGASVEVGGVVQESGSTQNNFTNPVEYVVTAADGSKATYSVIVTVALNTAKAITSFSLAGVAGTINEGAKTISVTMPYGTSSVVLIATFTTTGASVKVGATVQVSGGTQNDFTDPVAYVVAAADGSTATYTVTVTVLPRFTDNGDGTMTDNSTGLMWQKAPVDDLNPWQASLDYSRALSFAGHDDWYMPTFDDLQKVIHGWTGASPADWLTSQGFSNVQSHCYWSSSAWSALSTPTQAWVVHMGLGTTYPTLKYGDLCYVMPVRGQRFKDNGNGTITDRYNGLIWLQTPDSTKRHWPEAIDYCNGLVYAGYSNWRLPAVGELQELVIGWTGTYYPRDWLAAQGFSNVQFNYWSSTPYTPPNDVYYAWFMRMDVGSPAYEDKDYASFYAWPVRYGE